MRSNGKKVIYLQWGIILISLVLLSLLVYQNLNYRKKIFFLSGYIENSKKIIKALNFEKKMKKEFLFKKFPMEFQINQFRMYKNTEYARDFYYDNILIMIFDLTVCGRCLNNSFELLNEFEARAESKNIIFLSIAGIVNNKEISELISLFKSGQMPYPFKVVEVKSLYKLFHLDINNFLDTPFFMYTTKDLEVIDVYKPIYLDKEDLRRWLNTIIN